MARLTQWLRLVRYLSAIDGLVHYGEPIADFNTDLETLAKNGSLHVKVLEGATALSAVANGSTDIVQHLLGPLTQEEVPIVRCSGPNYLTHIEGTGATTPPYPILFTKASSTVHDTGAPVPIPPLGQNALDYEGELTVLIGRDAKDVSEADALDYVAAYVAGNDVSCRDWQLAPDKAGSIPQFDFSKSFDNYAPLGPALVSSEVLGDGSGLHLRTWVNGDLKQNATTSDMVFGVRKLVSFYSQGTTLKEGSLIMTGTPGGVALESENPQYLKDGDEVLVEISGIGKVRNVMKFL